MIPSLMVLEKHPLLSPSNDADGSSGARRPAEMHFISGKGGVGKSSMAAALTLHLAGKNEGPVLLVDVQGSGRALKLLGLNRQPFQNSALPRTRNAFGARILPRDTFKQYFSLILALGNEGSPFSQITSGFRDRITELIFENKIVTAFVDVCPGLEPAVLLGKLHWEATQGYTPEEKIPWRHVVVDAPSTGHGLMLFRSAFALTDVFGQGAIFKQATRMREFVSDTSLCKIYLATTPEELPIQESLEMKTGLATLGLKPYRYIVNRCPPKNIVRESAPSATSSKGDSIWNSEFALQNEIWSEQYELIKNLEANAGDIGTIQIPDLPQGLSAETLDAATAALSQGLAKASQGGR